jgi:4-amino-4-deoxy-L-arabinose transferase-like glycosyltransferase
MGLGSGIFLIAFGAILTFAIRANLWWLDLRAVGWVFMLAGLTVLLVTLALWQGSKKKARTLIVEENRLSHPTAMMPPPPDPPPPQAPPC